MAFDPFGDLARRGYMGNSAGTADPEIVKRLEHHAFAANVLTALEALGRPRSLGYDDVLSTNCILFQSVYPGPDRTSPPSHPASP